MSAVTFRTFAPSRPTGHLLLILAGERLAAAGRLLAGLLPAGHSPAGEAAVALEIQALTHRAR